MMNRLFKLRTILMLIVTFSGAICCADNQPIPLNPTRHLSPLIKASSSSVTLRLALPLLSRAELDELVAANRAADEDAVQILDLLAELERAHFSVFVWEKSKSLVGMPSPFSRPFALRLSFIPQLPTALAFSAPSYGVQALLAAREREQELENQFRIYMTDWRITEERVSEVSSRLESKIINEYRSNTVYDLRAAVGVALNGVARDLRRALLSSYRGISHHRKPLSIRDKEACAGDVVGDSLFARYFRAAVTGDSHGVSRLSYATYAQYSCSSRAELALIDVSLKHALEKFDEKWQGIPQLRSRSYEVLVQPLFLLLDLTSHRGYSTTFEWFNAKQSDLASSILNSSSSYLRQAGLYMWDKYHGSFSHFTSGCPVNHSFERSGPEARGCGGLADFIESIANPLAWGVGGCNGIDLLYGGAVGGESGLAAALAGGFDMSGLSGPTGDLMTPPVFSCPNECENISTAGDAGAGASMFDVEIPDMGQGPDMTPFGAELGAISSMCNLGGSGAGSRRGGGGGGMGGAPLSVGGLVRCLRANSADGKFLQQMECINQAASAATQQREQVHGVGLTGECSLMSGGSSDRPSAIEVKYPASDLSAEERQKLARAIEKAINGSGTNVPSSEQTQQAMNEGFEQEGKAAGMDTDGDGQADATQQYKISDANRDTANQSARDNTLVTDEPMDTSGDTGSVRIARTIDNGDGTSTIVVSRDALSLPEDDLATIINHEVSHAQSIAASHDVREAGGYIFVDGNVEHRALRSGGGADVLPVTRMPMLCDMPDQCSNSCSGADQMIQEIKRCEEDPEDAARGSGESDWPWGPDVDPSPDVVGPLPASAGGLQCLFDQSVGSNGSGNDVDVECTIIQCPAGQSAAMLGGRCGCGSSSRMGGIPGGYNPGTIDCLPGSQPECTGVICRCRDEGASIGRSRGQQPPVSGLPGLGATLGRSISSPRGGTLPHASMGRGSSFPPSGFSDGGLSRRRPGSLGPGASSRARSGFRSLFSH